MRRFEKVIVALSVGVLAFGALAVATGAGNGRYAAEQRTASVDIVGMLQEMLRTPDYAEPREAVREASIAELATMEDNLRRMSQELQLIPPTEQARGQALYGQLQQAQQQYQEASRIKSEEYLAFSGEQAAEVYTIIYAAVDAVAEREGYTHVFATRPGGVLDDTNNLNAVTQGMLARPLVRFPAEDDLTDKVRAEIGYEVPVDEPEAAEGDAGETGEPDGDDGDQP